MMNKNQSIELKRRGAAIRLHSNCETMGEGKNCENCETWCFFHWFWASNWFRASHRAIERQAGEKGLHLAE